MKATRTHVFTQSSQPGELYSNGKLLARCGFEFCITLDGYRIASWGATFDGEIHHKVLEIKAPFEVQLKGIKSFPVLLDEYSTKRIVSKTIYISGNLFGVDDPPAELFPDLPKAPPVEPPDPEPVKVVMSRFGTAHHEKFTTIREALKSIHSAVESNEAAPVSLTMPATVFGAKPIKFDTFQLYVMAELVQEPDNV